jgi:hypothetical protein
VLGTLTPPAEALTSVYMRKLALVSAASVQEYGYEIACYKLTD